LGCFLGCGGVGGSSVDRGGAVQPLVGYGSGWLQKGVEAGLWWLLLQQEQNRGREGEMRGFGCGNK